MRHNKQRLLTGIAVTSMLLSAGAAIGGAQVVRVPLPNSNFPISQGVWVGDTYYLSGTGDRMAGKLGATTTGNKSDFAGFMKGYTQFFGTTAQPNKPARSAVQVGALVFPGGLIEIEVIAARPK